MSEPYTPTTDEVCSSYYAANASVNDSGEAEAEFDRWLAAHDKEVLDKAVERAEDEALVQEQHILRGEPYRLWNIVAAIRGEVEKP